METAAQVFTDPVAVCHRHSSQFQALAIRNHNRPLVYVLGVTRVKTGPANSYISLITFREHEALVANECMLILNKLAIQDFQVKLGALVFKPKHELILSYLFFLMANSLTFGDLSYFP